MEYAPFAALGVLIARPAMLISTAPVFGGTFAPAHVRIGLAVLLALAMVPHTPLPAIGSSVAIALIIAREMAIGLAIGLAMRALVAGAEMAGHLTATQVGFTYGAVVDPQSGVRNNVLAALYGNLATITFFAIDGHHALIRAMAASYAQLPIGGGGIDGSLVRSVMEMLGVVFVMGVRFAMPIIIVLLVVEVALGLISRSAPMLNLLVVAAPVRVIVGLLVVAAVVPAAPGLVRRFSALLLELGSGMAGAFR
ncbi:MAG: flagellar biosynthetic protein FliR [Vicinamibacterales bacterium]